MKNFRTFFNLVLFVPLLFIGGCGEGQQIVRPPTPVISSKVAVSDVPLYIDTIGYCTAYESVNIVPQVSGEITAVDFEQGQAVKCGDLLYVIDPRIYEANLTKAEAQLCVAKARREVDIAQLERSKSLTTQNYISDQQYEAYESQAIQDMANVESATADVARARVDLEHCFIRSPIGGIAGAYLVDVGNVVTAMSIGKPLVTVENVDLLYVEFSISENDFHSLQRCFGDSGELDTEISSISGGGSLGKASIKFIDNAIDRRTGSLKLRAVMENGDHKFWPGESVRVKVLLTTLKNAVLVHSEAVNLSQNGRYVLVINEDKSVKMQLVEIGQIHGDMLVTANGLSGGETVVQRGQMMLAPGMKVMEMPDVQAGVFKRDLEYNKKIAEKNPTTD
jgi:multidrug efflux system membrane fusion protein